MDIILGLFCGIIDNSTDREREKQIHVQPLKGPEATQGKVFTRELAV